MTQSSTEIAALIWGERNYAIPHSKEDFINIYGMETRYDAYDFWGQLYVKAIMRREVSRRSHLGGHKAHPVSILVL